VKKLIPIVVAAVIVGVLLALLFIYLEFGGVNEQMIPNRPEGMG
jgi:putative effector of murein hydrolase LrgA (UPF0299 family)